MRSLADASQVARLIDRLAEAIAADVANQAAGPWALVGIRSRGDLLAQRLAHQLKPDHLGVIDITLYRDDLSEVAAQPVVRTTDIPFAIDNLNVVLVDDVLMTGRSVRAALQSLMDFGRPRRVWLSVLVDRGGRELPIAADHVALDLTGRDTHAPSVARFTQRMAPQTIPPGHRVEVHLRPTDACDQIVIRPDHAEAEAP